VAYPVYSAAFVRAASVGNHVYTVPAGYRAVVKHIACVNFAPAGSALAVQVAGLYVAYFPFQVTNSDRQQALMAVAYGGQTVVVSIPAAGMHTTVSGFLLREDPAARSLTPAAEVHELAEPTAPWSATP
jgi:hypothetical protein